MTRHVDLWLTMKNGQVATGEERGFNAFFPLLWYNITVLRLLTDCTDCYMLITTNWCRPPPEQHKFALL